MPMHLYVIKTPVKKDNCDKSNSGLEQKFDMNYDLVKDHSDQRVDDVKNAYDSGTVVEVYELPKNSLESQVLSVKLVHRMAQETDGNGLDSVAP